MGYERFPPLLATPACPSLLVQTVGILMILDPKFVPLHDEFSVKIDNVEACVCVLGGTNTV